jgi:hypothetical protein
MDNILRKLLTLFEKGTVEHRGAAFLVLGALKLESAHVFKTVNAVLDQPNSVLKDFALGEHGICEDLGSLLDLASIITCLY